MNYYLQTVVLVGLVLASGAHTTVARTWTDQTGRQVDGDFVSLKDGKARIKRTSDGKVFDVPLEKLSDSDQEFVKSQIAVANRVSADALLASETKKFQGNWTRSHGRSADGWVTTLQGLRVILEVKGDSFTSRRVDVEGDPGKFIIDPTKKPREIDLVVNPRDGGEAYKLLGIYEFLKRDAGGETLVIGFGEKGQARPKDLSKTNIDFYVR